MSDIKESDWRVLRELEPLALNRFCQRVLDDVATVAADAGKSPHKRYGTIYGLIKDRDRELARAFNDLRRSTAIVQLADMRRLGLLTDAEFERFSEETRRSVELWLGH